MYMFAQTQNTASLVIAKPILRFTMDGRERNKLEHRERNKTDPT